MSDKEQLVQSPSAFEYIQIIYNGLPEDPQVSYRRLISLEDGNTIRLLRFSDSSGDPLSYTVSVLLQEDPRPYLEAQLTAEGVHGYLQLPPLSGGFGNIPINLSPALRINVEEQDWKPLQRQEIASKLLGWIKNTQSHNRILTQPPHLYVGFKGIAQTSQTYPNTPS